MKSSVYLRKPWMPRKIQNWWKRFHVKCATFLYFMFVDENKRRFQYFDMCQEKDRICQHKITFNVLLFLTLLWSKSNKRHCASQVVINVFVTEMTKETSWWKNSQHHLTHPKNSFLVSPKIPVNCWLTEVYSWNTSPVSCLFVSC